MKHQELAALVESTFDRVRELLRVKGGEYASDDDALANFRRGSRLTGVPSLTVAMVYASKHYDGIGNFVRDRLDGTRRASSEPIEGRLDDLIVYCILMKALIKEGPLAAEELPLVAREIAQENGMDPRFTSTRR